MTRRKRREYTDEFKRKRQIIDVSHLNENNAEYN